MNKQVYWATLNKVDKLNDAIHDVVDQYEHIEILDSKGERLAVIVPSLSYFIHYEEVNDYE